MVRRLLLALLLLPSVAAAQTNSNPAWVRGFVPSAAQWNHEFGLKADGLNGQMVNPTITGGGSLSGTFTGSPILSGAVTLSAAGTALAVTNNATIGGTFGVTGASTFGAGSNNILVLTPGAATSNAVTIRSSGTGGVAIGGTGFDMFKFVPNASSTGSTVFTQPSVSTSPFVFSLSSNTGGWSWAGPTTMTNQASAATLTLTGNTTTLSNSFLCGYICSSTFLGGTLTGSVTASAVSFTISDKITDSSSNAPVIFNLTHNVASNGNSATGNRISFGVLQNIIGTSQAGTYTNTGINEAGHFAIWSQSNQGGSAGSYQGSHTALALYCQLRNGATFNKSCVGQEIDLSGETGSSYERNTQMLWVHLSGTTVQGDMSPDYGLLVADASGATARGYKSLIQLGNANGAFPHSPNGAFLFARRATSPGVATMSTVIDVTNVTMTGCDYRAPFSISCPIQANSITGVTRLTSDGAAASSYVYQTTVTNQGTLYTTNPVITVTGCTGAVIYGQLGSGGVIQDFGVNTAGSACAAEATMAVAASGGVTATGTLVIAGNTLNFPINSTINVSCKISATTLTHSGTDAVGWSIVFGATMGATASTTAIVGSPTWTTDYQTAGAAAKFSGSSPAVPAADTTYGAINLSATPTSGTWDIGGRCTMTKSKQT